MGDVLSARTPLVSELVNVHQRTSTTLPFSRFCPYRPPSSIHPTFQYPICSDYNVQWFQSESLNKYRSLISHRGPLILESSEPVLLVLGVHSHPFRAHISSNVCCVVFSLSVCSIL